MKLSRLLFPAMALLFALLGPPTPARADCVDDCERAYGGCSGPDADACLERLQTCYHDQCSKSSTLYGAIAYGPKSTADGYAYDMQSAQAAQQTALSYCRKNDGDDCQVVITFSNSCAAVAAVEDKGVYSTAQGGSKDDAQNAAMQACTKAHGDGCEIEAWSCTGQ